jgi:hypothetical protein
MNPATLHPDRGSNILPSTPPAQNMHTAIESAPDDFSADYVTPTSRSYLEPEGEGILFAAFCLISSLIIYCGVLLIRFLG